VAASGGGGINNPNASGFRPDGKFLFVSEYADECLEFYGEPGWTLWAGERYMECARR